ncbi:hypothetical protein Tco_1226698 [Tanacetum coccineum]
MYYPKFTKAIIHHFLSKDKSISMRNIMFMHTAQDDNILGTLRFVSKDEDTQVGAATLKPKRIYKKHDSPMIKRTTTSPEETPSKRKSAPAKKDVSSKKPSRKQSTGVQIKDTPEDAQIKKFLKWSKRETYSLQASGLGNGVGSQPKVPDEPKGKITGKNEGTESEDDDDSNDDDSDDVCDDDGNDDDNDNDGNNDASNYERTDSDKDENPNLNQNDDDIEEEYEDEYVHTPSSYQSTDDENEHIDEEEYNRIKELYKDMNVELKDVEHGEEGKRDAELTDADHDNVTQEKTYDQDEDDAYFLNLDNIPPTDTEINSMMNIDVHHEEPSNHTPPLFTIHVTVIPETSTTTTTTIPPPIPPFTPLPHRSTPTPTPTTEATTSLPVIPDFSSLFGFNQRVSIIENELSKVKQADQSAQLLTTIKSQIPAMIDAHLDTRIGDSIQKALWLYTAEFKKEAQAEKERYIDLIEKSVKDIINNEVKTQIPQILPKAVSYFASPAIKSTVTESLEDIVLSKSSSQPQSTYEAAALLTEFELKKILLDKMQKSKTYRGAKEHEELYDGLVKYDKLDKDLFESYWKTSKDTEPSKGPKSKESKTSSSKGNKSQPKSFGKSAQAKELVFEDADTEMPQNQGSDLGNTAYVMNHLKIDNLTQDHLVGPVFNLLKGTCRSRVELENNIEECYKAPLPLIMDRGRQVVPVDYFINNDLEYLSGGSSSKKYTTFTTKTKAAKYNIPSIEDMVPSLWSPVKKKLNITKPETFSSDIFNRTPYTTYNNPQGIIYEDKYKRNRLMHTDELYKFSDGSLTSVRSVLHDIC